MAIYNPKGASNWRTGKRGFQSALNPCQQSRSKKFWTQSKSMDQTADWSDFKRLMSQGVPERHLSFLHGIWRGIQKICLDVGVIPINPTYRSLKWWSYVAEYHGDSITVASDIQIVGDQYMVREMFSDVGGDPFTKKDIDMWLMYEPWVNQENMRRYLSLIRDGKINSIDWASSGWGLEISDSLERADQYPEGYGMSVLNWLLATSPEPYLLPSQIIERYSIFARPQ